MLYWSNLTEIHVAGRNESFFKKWVPFFTVTAEAILS